MDWKEILDQTVSQTVAYAAPIVGAIIVSMITIGIKRFNAWVQSRDLGERMKTAVLQVSEATVATVADLEATVRPYMSDGKLTLAEQMEIKDAAIARITKQVPNALQVLTTAGMKDLESYIGGKIEQEVMKLPESTGGK